MPRPDHDQAIRTARLPTGGARMSSTRRISPRFIPAPSCWNGKDGWPRPAEAWRHIVDYATERGWELTAIWPRQELQRVLGLPAGKPEPGREPQEPPE